MYRPPSSEKYSTGMRSSRKGRNSPITSQKQKKSYKDDFWNCHCQEINHSIFEICSLLLAVKSILQPPLLPARHTYMFTHLNTEINIPTLLLLHRSCILHKRKSACICIMMFLSSKYSPLRSILGNQIANMESKFVFQSKKDFIESTRKIYQQMLATLDDRLFVWLWLLLAT